METKLDTCLGGRFSDCEHIFVAMSLDRSQDIHADLLGLLSGVADEVKGTLIKF